MAERGAPFGNDNRAKQYRIKSTFERILARRSKSEELEALEKSCEAVIEKAEAGDMAAFKEMADRLDGRAAQTQDVNVKHSGSIEHRGLPEIGERVAGLLTERTDSDRPPLLPH